MRSGHDADPAKLIFVSAEFSARQQRVERVLAGNQVVRGRRRNLQLAQRDNLDAADEIERAIDDQAVFRFADRDCAISHDAVRIVVRRVAVKSGRQIDRENKCILFPAQTVDFLRCGSNRFAQQMFCTEAEQAVEDN